MIFVRFCILSFSDFKIFRSANLSSAPTRRNCSKPQWPPKVPKKWLMNPCNNVLLGVKIFSESLEVS